MSGEIKLKPCPFCGAEAHLWRTNSATYIECSKYNPRRHQVAMVGNTDEAAVEKWNKREGEQKNEPTD